MTAPAKAPEADLATLKRMFAEARDLTADARRESNVDIDYYDGYQWTAAERRVLQDRRQPDNVFNRVRPAINGTLGVLKGGQTDPKAYPRTPQDDKAADVATKALRYIGDQVRFHDIRLRCAKDYFVAGICAVTVEIGDKSRVALHQIRFEEFFYDPRSRREDFKDARYMGVAKWMYADDVAGMYPDKKSDIDAATAGGSGSVVADETYQDRPGAASAWVDSRQKRLLVVDMYYRDAGAGWMRCVFYSGGQLECSVSPYLDDDKRPCCPIEAQSAFVDRENRRYGLVRDMRGPQDEINKRRSKLLHILNNRQVRASDPQHEGDVEMIRKEAARPDGVLPFGWEPVQTGDMAAGQFNLLAEAKGEIERMGPNPAILGRQGADASGRAQLVRQQAGLTELAMVLAGLEDWELRVYRQKWQRARQFWTAPDFIRVTDDEGAPSFIGINQPVPGPPQVVMDPATGLATIQPSVLGYDNAIAEMDVDITLDVVPDTANVAQEQFQILAELAKIYGPQAVPFDDMLALSNVTGAQEMIEKRKARAEEAQQVPPAQRAAMALQMRGAQAEIANTEAETALTNAKAQNELMKPQIEAFHAGLASVEGTRAAAV